MWQHLIWSLHLRNFLCRLPRLYLQPQIGSQAFACTNMWQVLKMTHTWTHKHTKTWLNESFSLPFFLNCSDKQASGKWSFIFGTCNVLHVYWIQSDKIRVCGGGKSSAVDGTTVPRHGLWLPIWRAACLLVVVTTRQPSYSWLGAWWCWIRVGLWNCSALGIKTQHDIPIFGTR